MGQEPDILLSLSPLEDIFGNEPFTTDSITSHFEQNHYLYGDDSDENPKFAIMAEVLGQPASGKHSICTVAQSLIGISINFPPTAVMPVRGIPARSTFERDFWASYRTSLIEMDSFDPFGEVTQLKREISLYETLNDFSKFRSNVGDTVPALITPNFTMQAFVANLLGVEEIRERLIERLVADSNVLVDIALNYSLRDFSNAMAMTEDEKLTYELWQIIADGSNPFKYSTGSLGVWYQSPTPFIFFTNSRRDESVERARRQQETGSLHRNSRRVVTNIPEQVWIAQNIIHGLILNRFGRRTLKNDAFAFLLDDEGTFPFAEASQMCSLIHAKLSSRFN